MILTRKILFPVLTLFALLLTGLFFYIYSTYQASNNEEEQRSLLIFNESFDSEIQNQEKIVLGLAQNIANNPQVQEAFANQDREKLLEVSTPIFEPLKQFDVTDFHFQMPPAIAFLRVNSPESFGDDLSGYREMVVNVNTNQQALVDFETSQIGLGIHGIVPVYYQGKFVGSLDLGIDAGNAFLNHLVEKYGNEWHVLLTQEAVLKSAPTSLPSYKAGPIKDLLLYATTKAGPIFNKPDVYTRVLNGEKVIAHINASGRDYAIVTGPIQGNSRTNLGALDIVVDRTDVAAKQSNRLLIGGLTVLFMLVFGGLGIALITPRALQPMSVLRTAATEIASGNLSSQIETPSTDEIGDVASAFNSMSSQVQESISTLEQRVAERTRDLERRTLELETISDVVREIAIIRDMNTLLNVSVNLIRERFNYYHTGIFLLDERGEYAILRAGSGAGAQRMLEQRYKLKISEIGALGATLRGGQIYISSNMQNDNALGRSQFLPETISEIILPLQVFNVTIGALDIHSNKPVNFDEQDTHTLKLLADQLAAAIENAQLVQQVEGTVGQLNKAYRSQTQQAWQTAVGERQISSYEYDGKQVRSIPDNLPEELMRQLESGEAVVVPGDSEDDYKPGETKNTLLIPLMVLSQLIGVIGLEQDEPGHIWTNEEITVAQAAANRTALTLENARLLEESQRRALKERTISEATARIGTTLNVENILQSTIEELERVLGNSEIVLQINNGALINSEAPDPYEGKE